MSKCIKLPWQTVWGPFRNLQNIIPSNSHSTLGSFNYHLNIFLVAIALLLCSEVVVKKYYMEKIGRRINREEKKRRK